MKLADEWKQAWKWLQTWLVAMLSIAPLLYEQFALLQDYIPPSYFRVGMVALGMMTLANMVRKKRATT